MVVKSSNCKYCAFERIEYCDEQGETLCINCGAVLEERGMVELLQYSETPSGGSAIVGQFLPTVGCRHVTLAFGSKQSRGQIIQRGYSNIQRIAGYLHLSTQHVEAAQRIYLLAVQRSFTIGRNNLHVAACCLYIICRREKTPHLLIDFSDVLQTPVKILGQIFMKLVRLLHISVPNVDPSIFFERFASQLKIKDKIRQITATGIRLIQAMDRDWLCTGRRPTGLCGAALVVASRYHGVPLSESAVANVVRISNYTIIKRLSEFKLTATARLTRGDFERLDLTELPQLSLPPCLRSSAPNLVVTDLDSAHTDCGRSESGLTDIRSISVKDFSVVNASTPSIANSSVINGSIDGGSVNGDGDKICELDTLFSVDDSMDNSNDVLGDTLENSLVAESLICSEPMKSSPGGSMESDSTCETMYEPPIVPQEMIDSVKETLLRHQEKQRAIETMLDNFNSYIESSEPNSECETDETISEPDEEDELVISQMILTDKERECKATIWDEMTRDVMPHVWRRLQERQKRASTEHKRKYVKRKIQYPEASNAAESVKMALERHGKGLVKRLNYNALYSLLT
ncbi:Transcription factor IIIB 90 kDa subunit [Babesia microti strain RI]|uniref:B-related factor 1 n=1 Tax=Babesia microti (strain RI) TaxID=1133968 RepID=A0A1R4ACI1_BABMR|nr:Transcription factor IIIB 90 kDa subunit [Babesia microti strain RI]SJK86716.1 Transcription factor IIIB 90 kDa subunit [Babesia microti strain RI]|eukprot:XP_021338839.1 Transcription factor IIIB 90 kDa subunit [Babesia microti strain RI]